MNEHNHHASHGRPGHVHHDSSDEHAGHGAHDKHAGHSVAMFRDKFWISLSLTVPTLVWGHMLPRVLGYAPPHVPGSQWIAPRVRHGGVPLRRTGRSSRARGASCATGCPA